MEVSDIPLAAWAVFFALLGLLLIVELAAFPRAEHIVRLREAEALAVLWVGAAVVVGLAIAAWLGSEAGVMYGTAYLKSLDLGHVLVFAVVFEAFSVPRQDERRVLFWGVLVAIPVRLVLILAGAAAVAAYTWVVPLFGVFLVASAVRIARVPDFHGMVRHDAERISRRLTRVGGHLPAVRLQSDRFIARVDGRLVITPLLLALVAVELADLFFSVDSLPGLYAVSDEPFLLFAANILATIALRALYFVAENFQDRYRFWREGLIATLAFVGAKMILDGVIYVDPLLSLAVVGGIVGLTLVASWLWPGGPPGGSGPTSPR